MFKQQGSPKLGSKEAHSPHVGITPKTKITHKTAKIYTRTRNNPEYEHRRDEHHVAVFHDTFNQLTRKTKKAGKLHAESLR